MKRGLSVVGIFLTALSSSLCSSCGKTFPIKFDCVHCKRSGGGAIDPKNGYKSTFKIDFGWQLLEDEIKVTNNGVIDNDCWTFMYQSNIVNSFRIKPNTAKGDIKVKINCTSKKLFEYGLAIDVDEVDQTTIHFLPKDKEWKYIEDWQRYGFAISEDENLDFTFEAKSGKTLPTNIGMWMNGRYSREKVEVTFKYSKDRKSCHVTVPYFVVKDNLQFRLK